MKIVDVSTSKNLKSDYRHTLLNPLTKKKRPVSTELSIKLSIKVDHQYSDHGLEEGGWYNIKSMSQWPTGLHIYNVNGIPREPANLPTKPLCSCIKEI